MFLTLDFSIPTVSDYLRQNNKVQKLNKWVPQQFKNAADTHWGWAHSLYYPDLSPPDCHFFKHLETFLSNNSFMSKIEVEAGFIDFLESEPMEFYQQNHK
ncbi:hypothetical protein NPIL_487691 [Nephila pilipes]|uniref:Uncharacterized protein n=1 Tax=Nephila pilipes TaxID=299642 RepID=A0A8X6Q0H1_NEPPI|nr:hypothetical protein NPIL_487691 [Nephila pilipes]